jgi:hypothetical protein
MITVRTSPAYVNRVRQDWTANGGVYGDGGVYALVPSNDPFAQLGPTLDLTFAGNPTDLLTASTTAGYTLDTYFTPETYQIAVPYAIWEDGVGLSQKTFAQIVTFTRASTATYFNSAGTLTSAAVNEARFDYNPSTLAPLGFLIEESRTNSIRNNTMVGAVAGTPGTIPTNWGVVGTGLAFNVVGLGTEDGLSYVDIQLVGTTGGTSAGIRFETNTGIAAVAGQAWSNSVFARMVAGSTTNISSVGLNTTYLDGGAATINSLTIPFQTTISQTPLSAARRLNQNVVAGAGALYVRPQIVIAYSSGVAIDITLRIGLPQLEQGAFATSVIPTDNTAPLGKTREKDVASVNTLSPWYNAVEGTLYAEWVARLGVDQQAFGLVDVGDGVRVRKRSTDQYGLVVRDPTNRDLALNASPAITEGQIIKVAGAYAINDLALSGGGQSPATGSTYSVVTATSAFIGGNVSAGATYVNGHIRRICYYPRRLSNADLQTITT